MHAFIHDFKHGISAISNHPVPLPSVKELISRPRSQKERWVVRSAHAQSTEEDAGKRALTVRFRKALIAHDLDKVLFDKIAVQLKAKAILVKTGTLVDATIVASASEDDDEDRWVKHKGRPAVHRFKAHVSADAGTALVEEIAVTTANINDGKAGPEALPEKPGFVYAGAKSVLVP
jgi:IS5 family transposase